MDLAHIAGEKWESYAFIQFLFVEDDQLRRMDHTGIPLVGGRAYRMSPWEGAVDPAHPKPCLPPYIPPAIDTTTQRQPMDITPTATQAQKRAAPEADTVSPRRTTPTTPWRPLPHTRPMTPLRGTVRRRPDDETPDSAEPAQIYRRLDDYPEGEPVPEDEDLKSGDSGDDEDDLWTDIVNRLYPPEVSGRGCYDAPEYLDLHHLASTGNFNGLKAFMTVPDTTSTCAGNTTEGDSMSYLSDDSGEDVCSITLRKKQPNKWLHRTFAV